MEMVNFPLIIPYTKTWYGKKAADMIMEEFSKCSAKSKIRMATGAEITCIMDGWVKAQLFPAKYRELKHKGLSMERIEKPSPLLRDFTNHEIAQTIFTFLFASQDATSRATTWLFKTMAQRPDVLGRMGEENFRVRDGDKNKSVSLDMLNEMTYTRAAVRKLLRYRPPITMMPFVAKKAFPITGSCTVPKG